MQLLSTDQDRTLERLSIDHAGASLQVQLADTPGAVLVTALDDTGALYEIDDAGHARLVRHGAPASHHHQDHLFNAPATMPGQIALGGIE